MTKSNKYKQIFEDLSEKIQDGTYQANTILPSENELTVMYSTSRETIRKALTLLAQKGLIQKLRGKGSLVLDASRMSFPVSGLVSFKELQTSMGRESIETYVHDFGLIRAAEVANQLETSRDSEVWKVVRSRKIGGERIILDKSYFLKEQVPLLTKDICENSIYEYLEGELNLPIDFAKKEIVVEQCTEEDRKHLDLHGYDHVVVVKNYVHLKDATLFEYTESRHRLDMFRFVDFARRKN
ncbi:trehalose operon repressor [Bacillus sp. KH172YL63]|uniref:trehalose operon repressor n=1 Tax=Bacillus sp. KH172YL63 TaxID=2709784 RepID=UPI0013E49A15|nr:trehalose operon repressor [Bacillus sp. KH172YL63]BCB05749.1 HTH-type transcriptional regulator TreR [Bacillus sp. KH172YL63]